MNQIEQNHVCEAEEGIRSRPSQAIQSGEKETRITV
jgi:hypothetical protein